MALAELKVMFVQMAGMRSWPAGKGEGGARRGDKIIAFSGTILSARPGSPPPPDTAGHSNSTVQRAVWSRLFAGLTVEAERASRVFVHEIDA